MDYKNKLRGISMDDLRKYLTATEAGEKLDITEEWVRDLIARQEIKAVKIGQSNGLALETV